jgi:hypothetical protein
MDVVAVDKMTRNPQQIIIGINSYTEVHNAALMVMVFTTVLQHLNFLSMEKFTEKFWKRLYVCTFGCM